MKAADPTFRRWAESDLVWLPERGMGYLPVEIGEQYNLAYWSKYETYAATPLSESLTQKRLEVVRRYLPTGPLVDVGIGCGTFVQARGPETYGFDINPVAVEWLHCKDLWFDPYAVSIQAASFWDSIEHLIEPARLLANVDDFAFLSLPIFVSPDHVLRSKHFRRDEHLWYWTREGLILWMSEQGFQCIEHGTPESLLSREDIHTFVFQRRGG